jgi:hypothetical protein
LTPKEKDVCQELLSRGAKDGNEHLFVGTVDGGTYYTSGSPDKVQFERSARDALDQAPVSSASLWHSHPSGSAPSTVDFEKLLIPSVSSVGVIGHNGNVYRVSIGDGWIPEADALTRAADSIAVDFDDKYLHKLYLDEWSSQEYNYRRTREKAYRLANLYEWTYEGGELM